MYVCGRKFLTQENDISMHRSLLQVFSIALIIAILFSGFVLPSAHAQTGTTWYVATTGNDSNSCSSTNSPCATIDGAIAKAAAGNTIKVAIGTYTGTGTEIVPINKNLTLSGGWDVSFTTRSGRSTIDGQAARRGIEVWGGAVVTIEYFNVQNGLECAGGGISNSYGSALTLNQSLISNNDSRCTGAGAGIENGGTMTINNSTIKDNDGGGIDSMGLLTVNNSTISGNVSRAGAGAALANWGTATFNNSTVSGNTSWDNGGGGIANIMASATLILNNSTITGNSALLSDGGGLLNKGSVTMQNTVLALNTSTSYPSNTLSSSDCSGGHFGPNIVPCVLNSLGYNLIGNNSNISFSVAIGDLVGTNSNPIDPRLTPLQDNGGPTFTHALLSDSPALNAGNPAVPGSGGNACLATDQRGVTRPSGSQCDIGAYEEDGATGYLTISGNTVIGGVTLSYTNGTPKTVNSDQVGNYSIRVPSGWSGTVTPSRVDFIFTPANRTYDNIQSDQTNQDYAAQGFVKGADTTGVFRPSNGLLYLKNHNTTGFADVAINYGLGGDYPVVGDWDRNGTVTIGVYRNGNFYLRNQNSLGYADMVFAFGLPGDQPIAGDWNGDGMDTIGVYRNGLFLLRNSNDAGSPEMSFVLGNPGDVGIAGDWNGDGLDTTGVFRPSNGYLYLKNINITGFADLALNYGLPGDKPVTGDWDGDGDATIGVYRGNTFYLRNENTNGFANIVFSLGNAGDMPIAGNWDALP